MSIHVTTKINGDVVDYVCDADETLLDVLRNRLGLTGAKEGCGTGDCGACSVTIDGRLTCSCLVLGAEAEGSEIGTIEGMAEGEELHERAHDHHRDHAAVRPELEQLLHQDPPEHVHPQPSRRARRRLARASTTVA